VSSPLQRCIETADGMLAEHDPVSRHVDDRLGEVRYGDWSGKELKALAKDPLWRVVQDHPSAMVFPGEGGEAMRDMQARAVEAVREWNSRLGEDAVYAVVSHGDVLKSVLADALGLHLDQFQRIVVDPASVSVVTYTPVRPFVVRMNDVGGDFAGLAMRRRRRRGRRPASDAAVGGGAGPTT
jgi:probable phosphomutase (TIGR03848 family)